jgi:hypothetical protein
MKSPRAPGAGTTRAWISLGSGTTNLSVARAGSSFNDRRKHCAAALDREADLMLSVGRHAAAERLAHQAAEMRHAEVLA